MSRSVKVVFFWTSMSQLERLDQRRHLQNQTQLSCFLTVATSMSQIKVHLKAAGRARWALRGVVRCRQVSVATTGLSPVNAGCSFNVYFLLAAGDEGSSSGSGSGCSDGCTTEFVYIGTEAPVVGVDRSDERVAVAAGKSPACGPSPLLVATALALSLAALKTQRR